ncbi:MAG: hypothetical protein ACE5GW_11165, partial [Planctomycetota bacterium]
MPRGLFVPTLIIVTLIAGARVAPAQDADYLLSFSEARAPHASIVEVSTRLTITAEPVMAWSYSVCHDPGKLTLLDVQFTPELLEAVGYQSDSEIAFFDTQLVAGGWTTGVILDFFEPFIVVPAGSTALQAAHYFVEAQAPDSTILCFCTLQNQGGNPIEPLIMPTTQFAVVPTLECGSVEIVEELFLFIAPNPSATYHPETGEGPPIEAPLAITQLPETLASPQETLGFSMGLAHDPGLLEAVAVDIQPLADLLGIAEPDLGFFSAGFVDGGVVIGVVYDATAGATIAYSEALVVANVIYETVAANLIGTSGSVTTALTWSDALIPPGGGPPVANVVTVVPGVSAAAIGVDGSVTLTAVPITLFRRADPNRDGSVDISDAVAILFALFQDSSVITCNDAADLNVDGQVDIADAVSLFSFRFLGAAPPPPPFPDCGAGRAPPAGPSF